MIIYFCQGWTGWLFVTWMPSLLQKNYGVEMKKSSFLYMALLFSAILAELLGGMITDCLLRRTGSLQIARSLMIAVSWVFAVAGLVPVILFHDMVIGVSGFMITVFFLGFAISPLWTATMDIAPDYAGTSSSLMNASGAVAGILSPVAFAWILDRTGSWTTAVRGLGLSVAVRHRHDLLDPAGPPDRGRSRRRPVGGGRGIDHLNSKKRSPGTEVARMWL